jgi:Sugar (and other) transporter
MMGVIATAACLTYIDKVGRRVPLILSSSAQAIFMMLIMIFYKIYAQSDNKVGQGFTIAWIFMMSISFSLG